MIYVVDDAADYRFLVQHVFGRFLPQYPIRLFADGLELIQAIEGPSESSPVDLARPDLLVLDVDMPKLNGLQTLEHLKQNSLWQTVPVVMMSNRIGPEFMETASKLGASTYLTKPMDIAELKAVMEQLCHQWVDS